MTEQQLECNVRAVAKKFAEDPLAVTASAEANPASEVGSHLLFTTIPASAERDTSILRVATPHLDSFVKTAIASLDAAKQISFYSQASSHPFFRSAFGYIFEKYFYIWFSLADHDNELLSTLASSRPGSRAPKKIRLQPIGEEKLIIYGGESGKNGYKTANKRELPFGWIPSSRSDASFDAVMCTAKYIFTFQVTVASNHSMNETGFKSLAKNLPKKFQRGKTWVHVFVTNHPGTAAALAIKKYTVPKGMKISIYTAVLDFSSFRPPSENLNRTKAPDVSRHEAHSFCHLPLSSGQVR